MRATFAMLFVPTLVAGFLRGSKDASAIQSSNDRALLGLFEKEGGRFRGGAAGRFDHDRFGPPKKKTRIVPSEDESAELPLEGADGATNDVESSELNTNDNDKMDIDLDLEDNYDQGVDATDPSLETPISGLPLVGSETSYDVPPLAGEDFHPPNIISVPLPINEDVEDVPDEPLVSVENGTNEAPLVVDNSDVVNDNINGIPGVIEGPIAPVDEGLPLVGSESGRDISAPPLGDEQVVAPPDDESPQDQEDLLQLDEHSSESALDDSFRGEPLVGSEALASSETPLGSELQDLESDVSSIVTAEDLVGTVDRDADRDGDGREPVQVDWPQELDPLADDVSSESQIENGEHDATHIAENEKLSWPEAQGMSGLDAMALIESEVPGVEVVIIPYGSMATMDFNLNRVRIFVDEKGAVVVVPNRG